MRINRNELDTEELFFRRISFTEIFIGLYVPYLDNLDGTDVYTSHIEHHLLVLHVGTVNFTKQYL